MTLPNKKELKKAIKLAQAEYDAAAKEANEAARKEPNGILPTGSHEFGRLALRDSELRVLFDTKINIKKYEKLTKKLTKAISYLGEKLPKKKTKEFIRIPLTEDDVEQFKNVVIGDESIVLVFPSRNGVDIQVTFVSEEVFDEMEKED